MDSQRLPSSKQFTHGGKDAKLISISEISTNVSLLGKKRCFSIAMALKKTI